MDHWRDVSSRLIVGCDMKSPRSSRGLEPRSTRCRMATLLLLLAVVLGSVTTLAESGSCCCSSSPPVIDHVQAGHAAGTAAHDSEKSHGVPERPGQNCLHLTCTTLPAREATALVSVVASDASLYVAAVVAVAPWAKVYESDGAYRVPLCPAAPELPSMPLHLLPLLI